jgi:hypothetical protein
LRDGWLRTPGSAVAAEHGTGHGNSTAGKYLWLLWRDPWEVLELPLPDGLDRDQLQQVRMIVYAILHLLDLTLDEAIPLIGRLVQIDRRLAVVGVPR